MRALGGLYVALATDSLVFVRSVLVALSVVFGATYGPESADSGR
jgi:hypothetical protein